MTTKQDALRMALEEITEVAERVDGWESFPRGPIDKAHAALAQAAPDTAVSADSVEFANSYAHIVENAYIAHTGEHMDHGAAYAIAEAMFAAPAQQVQAAQQNEQEPARVREALTLAADKIRDEYRAKSAAGYTSKAAENAFKQCANIVERLRDKFK